MDVKIYIISDAIFSIVGTRLRLPTETLLKGMQAGMQLELYCEWLGQACHQIWVGSPFLPRLPKRLVKLEFPLQRYSLAVKTQKRLSTEHKMQKLKISLQ